MAIKIKVKLILELRAAQISQREICRTRKISHHSVIDVYRIADQLGITYEDIKDKSEEEVYRVFYPDKFASESLYNLPDYGYVHAELKKTGVTLKLSCGRSIKTPVVKTVHFQWDIQSSVKVIQNM